MAFALKKYPDAGPAPDMLSPVFMQDQSQASPVLPQTVLPKVVQASNPHLAHTLQIADGMSGPITAAIPSTEPDVVQDPNPLNQVEGHLTNKLQRAFVKEDQPKGFFGKLGDTMANVINYHPVRDENESLVNQLENVKKQQSEQALQGAQQTAETAQAQEAQARAKNLPIQAQETAAEQGMKIDASGNLVPQTPEEYSPKLKGEQELQQAQIYGLRNPWAKLPDKEPLTNVGDINAGMNDRYQVLHPGQQMPPHFLLGPNSTKGDFERVDRLMTSAESALGTQQQREIANQMRAQTYALALQNSQNREGKTDFSQRQAALKTYAPAMDAAERFNVMSENFINAVKNGDQQAMLSLLANHLGMTMGLQKGARITKDLYQEAAHSLPWLEKIGASFDSRGYLSGVKLSVPQMQQMVQLAQSRYGEDVKKSRQEAAYIGITDDGPKRIPNESTIKYYKGLTGGDGAKAKALAVDDGWTVE